MPAVVLFLYGGLGAIYSTECLSPLLSIGCNSRTSVAGCIGWAGGSSGKSIYIINFDFWSVLNGDGILLPWGPEPFDMVICSVFCWQNPGLRLSQ